MKLESGGRGEFKVQETGKLLLILRKTVHATIHLAYS
jgi:hypothetical protein